MLGLDHFTEINNRCDLHLRLSTSELALEIKLEFQVALVPHIKGCCDGVEHDLPFPSNPYRTPPL